MSLLMLPKKNCFRFLTRTGSSLKSLRENQTKLYNGKKKKHKEQQQKEEHASTVNQLRCQRNSPLKIIITDKNK